MSTLRAVVRPNLVTGFQLAGVEAYGAEDVEAAEELIAAWLDANETCLLALDDSLLAHLDPALIQRLDGSDSLLYLAIPSGGPTGQDVTRSARIARMIRRSIGVHIAIGNEKNQGDT